ncbi:putative disease resistance protein At3g14460 [Vigna unguiculata]|uniref:putative disease resistance protein At3g14460 n=1 Tax=Vigna unguiculata TaxID=3917 RepID=UPI001016BBB4|nr:putative disease resistance protein At3g14460 [Vigna unguiculata]
MEASSFDMIGPLVSHTPLECLRIDSCPGMNLPINHYYHLLVELRIIHGCDSLTIFPLDLFPKLRMLELYKCRNLQRILQGHPHNHLNSLIIEKCSQFESFPNEGLFAPQLLRIFIMGSEKLKSMPKRMCAHLPSLDHMIIDDCPGVELCEGCLPSNLKELRIFNCSKFVASLKEALSVNPSLQVLKISSEDIEYFPDEGLLPLSLTKIEIHDCPMLKKLDYRGLCHLSSLRELIILSCPILQSLPEEGLPESISDLEILDSPLLQQLYKKQEGEDWEKIAHIEYICVQGGIPWNC